MQKWIIGILALLSVALAAPSFGAAVPNASPPGFNVTSVSMTGTGCPPGTAYYVLSADRGTLTIVYDGFTAEVGPGVSIALNRRACQVSIGVDVPPGLSFGFTGVDSEGYYDLDDKIMVWRQTAYSFRGQTDQAIARSNLTGPIDDTYVSQETFDLVPALQSPCGVGSSHVLYTASELRVSNSANTKGYAASAVHHTYVGTTRS